jgi:hypothetical protein
VEVESTIRPAKGRIAGFEGREGHRTPFASLACKAFTLQGLLNVGKFIGIVFRSWCYWGDIGNPRNSLMQVAGAQMCVSLRHRKTLVAEKFSDVAQLPPASTWKQNSGGSHASESL